MHCAACSTGVERSLKKVAGVIGAQVNLASNSAQVRYDEQRTQMAELEQAITRMSFSVIHEGAGEASAQEIYRREQESMRHRLEVYYDRTFPLINFYREKGLLVPIDGAMSIGDVSNRIFAALDPIFEKNKKA